MNKSKTGVISDACYLAKLEVDLHDVEKFLEASETIVRNKMMNTEINSSLFIKLKNIETNLISTRGIVSASISFDSISKTKPSRPPRPENLCPECGEEPVMTCKCMRGDSTCKNGHNWHTCVVHMVIVKGESDHSLPTMTCTCGKGA